MPPTPMPTTRFDLFSVAEEQSLEQGGGSIVSVGQTVAATANAQARGSSAKSSKDKKKQSDKAAKEKKTEKEEKEAKKAEKKAKAQKDKENKRRRLSSYKKGSKFSVPPSRLLEESKVNGRVDEI